MTNLEIQNNLEEAAMNYIAPIENEDGLKVINFSGQDIKDAFIAGWKAKEESEKHAPNDLQEYASRAGFDYVDNIVQENPDHRWNDHDVEFAYRDGIIAGAKWQAEQLLKGSPLPEDTVLFNKGVEEGKRLMMEEAVEGVVYRYESYQRIATAIVVDINRELFGDKVRIIICKKED